MFLAIVTVPPVGLRLVQLVRAGRVGLARALILLKPPLGPVSPVPVERKTKNLNPCSATSAPPAVRANRIMAAVKMLITRTAACWRDLALGLPGGSGRRRARGRGGRLASRLTPARRSGGPRVRRPAGPARSVVGGAKAVVADDGAAGVGGACVGGAVPRLCVT